MSKLTRRDYLKQMAAASAIVGAAQLLSPDSATAANQGQTPVRPTVLKPKFLFTPVVDQPPAATNLTVLFGGIMGISNTKNGVAQVGFQKGTGKHKLEIKVYEITNGSCKELTIPNSAGVKTIEIAIPTQPASVNYFHKDNFERNLTVDDARDFGWVLDFEDSPLYPNGVAWRRRFRPVLTLNHGTFYTYQLTNSKFNLVHANNINNPYLASLNQLPRLVGTAIEIPAQKTAVLRFDGRVARELPQTTGVSYQIQFMNECYDGADHCEWNEPKHRHEAVRNDFYLHYRMFRRGFTKKCGVIADQIVAGSALKICPFDKMEGTDEAPCMATGFGKKTEFPVEP